MPTNPTDEPVRASTPDLALQLRTPTGTCLAPDTAETVRHTLETEVRKQFPGADVRQACVTSHAGIAATTIGVWTTPNTPALTAGRDLGLLRMQSIRGEIFAIFVNPAMIRAQVADRFSALPKHYNGHGIATPSGPIHLRDFALRFATDDEVDGRVMLELSGLDTRPAPDVPFTITFTDHLRVDRLGGTITSTADEPVLDTHVSDHNIFSTIAAGLLTLVFPPAVFFTQSILSAALQQPDGAPQSPGIGGSIVRNFFPDAVMIPGGDKLDLQYQRVAIDSTGVVAAGAAVTARRQPTCTIRGPRRIDADFRNAKVTADFAVHTTDLRGDLNVQWTGERTTASGHATSTTATFTFLAHVKGARVKRVLHARVVDADGLVAEAAIEVEVHFVENHEDDPPHCPHVSDCA